MKRVSLLCLIFCLFTEISLASSSSYEKDKLLIGALWLEIKPDNPENSWYPDYAKENLEWVIEKLSSEELSIQFIYSSEGKPLQFLMSSDYSEGKPIIQIVPDRFKNLLWLGLLSGINATEFGKNILLIGIVHEAEHLRWWSDIYSCEELKWEETRVWLIVNELLVSEMINDCRPVPVEHIWMREILDNGGTGSKEFQEFMESRVYCFE